MGKEFLPVRLCEPIESGAPRNGALLNSPGLDLQVIFSSVEETRATLKAAATMAQGLDARITIVAAWVVPYPLPLDSPPVPAAFIERQLWSIAAELKLETTVEVYLCRDRQEAIRRVLRPQSVVVMGARKRWWPTCERRMARLLRRDGHRVLFIDSKKVVPGQFVLGRATESMGRTEPLNQPSR